MSDLITLTNGEITAAVNRQGAFVEFMRKIEGPNLLVPRASFQTASGPKERATHLCLPQYGPAPAGSGLDQHGFGRKMPWNLVDTDGSSLILRLRIPNNGQRDVPVTYNGLRANFICNLLEGAGIKLELDLKNFGKKPINVAPGFHPYFPVPPDTEYLSITQSCGLKERTERTPLKALDPSQTSRVMTLGRTIMANLGTTKICIQSNDELAYLTTWTDAPRSYVCVEPSAAEQTLEPGEFARYSTSIKWKES